MGGFYLISKTKEIKVLEEVVNCDQIILIQLIVMYVLYLSKDKLKKST